MDKAALIALAKETAQKYGLGPELVCAVIEQESGWNCWACRFEPAFYQRYIVPSLEAGHIGPTEAYCRAVSWGLCQVIGQTARDCGFGGPFLSELCDPAIGLDIGCKFLSILMGKTGNNVEETLLRWNGGSNTSYPEQVLARMPTYA